MMKHKKPITQSVPLAMPKNGGKIRCPAPKNMANKASPVIKVLLSSRMLLYGIASEMLIMTQSKRKKKPATLRDAKTLQQKSLREQAFSLNA